MKKVLFINLSTYRIYDTPEKRPIHEPLWAECLSAMLCDHSVKIFDMNLHNNLEEILNESLKNTELTYFVDNQRNIILSYRYRIVSALPFSLFAVNITINTNKPVEDLSSFIMKEQAANNPERVQIEYFPSDNSCCLSNLTLS